MGICWGSGAFERHSSVVLVHCVKTCCVACRAVKGVCVRVCACARMHVWGDALLVARDVMRSGLSAPWLLLV